MDLTSLARTTVADYLAQFPGQVPGRAFAQYAAREAGLSHGQLRTFYAAVRAASAEALANTYRDAGVQP